MRPGQRKGRGSPRAYPGLAARRVRTGILFSHASWDNPVAFRAALPPSGAATRVQVVAY